MRQHCLDSSERVKLVLLKIPLLPQSVSRATPGCAAGQTASGHGPAAPGGGLRRRGRGRGQTWSLRWGREAGACLGPLPVCRAPRAWAGRQGRAGRGRVLLIVMRRSSRKGLTALDTCLRDPGVSVRCSCPTGGTLCRQRCSQTALKTEPSVPGKSVQTLQNTSENAVEGEAPNIICVRDCCGRCPLKCACVGACNFFLKGYH